MKTFIYRWIAVYKLSTSDKKRLKSVAVSFLAVMLLVGCTVQYVPPGPGQTTPQFTSLNPHGKTEYITYDGLRLPLRAWLPDDEPQAIVLALHGFNDYSRSFEPLGTFLSERGVGVFSYDQRGFGAGPFAGYWAGSDILSKDVKTAVYLLEDKYPDIPIYLAGESMGGALVTLTVSESRNLPVEGVILSAPAVWSSDMQPWYQNTALWVAFQLVPGWRPSQDNLGYQSTDNIEVLREMIRDPYVLKSARIDAIAGLVALMDRAFDGAKRLYTPTLLLYGERDELVPPEPVAVFWARLPQKEYKTAAVYKQGWHLLTRDLQNQRVLKDIHAWITDPEQPLPSRADDRAPRFFFAHFPEELKSSQDQASAQATRPGPFLQTANP